ncbi:MAG: hypothetical protein H3C51_13260 [Rubellimicrobium sp.]|nr:hypothetical protein [Rubellimicrobium sp.]
MRDFFIDAFEQLVAVIVVLMIIAVIIAAIAAGSQRGVGLAGAIAVLVGGGIYVIVMGGIMYLGLGIYRNTQRTTEALEAMARK